MRRLQENPNVTQPRNEGKIASLANRAVVVECQAVLRVAGPVWIGVFDVSPRRCIAGKQTRRVLGKARKKRNQSLVFPGAASV
jgi:hypothetical protein